jgi:HK97 family phage portal protein
MVRTELDALLKNPNELMIVINRLLMNNRIVWSNYDRVDIEKTIKENSYVFAAISKIAKACVNINLLVGKYNSDGVFEQDKENGLAKLLERPNPLLDKNEFKENLVFWYYPFGEAFVYGERYIGGNNIGQVYSTGLWFSPPQITEITANGMIPTGYIINTNIAKAFPTYNVMHMKAFNPDWKDLHGLPYVAVAGKLIDKLDAADETEVKNFQNGGPAYLASAKEADSYTKVEHENLISRLKSLWKDPKNRGGIVGTSGIVELKEVGKSPVDLGTIESSKNTLRMLCAVWGLDPGLFDVEASTYNNKQEINKSIYTEAAIPLMERFASKLTHWLGESYGGVQVIVDTSNVEVLQPNNQTKSQWMVGSRVFSDNEIREALGYEKIDNPVADLIPTEKLELDPLNGFEPTSLDQPIA